MKIYEFHNAGGQAHLYGPDEVCDRCAPDPPRPLAANWSPPIFEIVRSDEYRSHLPKTDFPTLMLGTIVLSVRAVERLSTILLSCGEVLPIHLSNDNDTFYLFNVTRVVNAIDMVHSEFLKLPSGSIGPCERLEFMPAMLPRDAVFFKTTQMGPVTEIFATEGAVKAVEDSRLSGHDFSLAWSNE